MKALTLHQPWASLVALGVQTIETRPWSTPHRGPLAIHAAKRPTDSTDLRLWMPLHSALKRTAPCGRCGHGDGAHVCHLTYTRCLLGRCNCDGWVQPPLPLGAVVATCTLADVVPIVAELSYDGSLQLEVTDSALLLCGPLPGARWPLGSRHSERVVTAQRPFGDFSPGRWAFLLTDVVALPEPVPARGRQRLWDWNPPEGGDQ